jgi:hypothetical protein
MNYTSEIGNKVSIELQETEGVSKDRESKTSKALLYRLLLRGNERRKNK